MKTYYFINWEFISRSYPEQVRATIDFLHILKKLGIIDDFDFSTWHGIDYIEITMQE
jgi:hypothetical protein